jgi:hypothetical protein
LMRKCPLTQSRTHTDDSHNQTFKLPLPITSQV